MEKLVTKQSMIEAIRNGSDEYVTRYVGRALVAIFSYQTEAEKATNTTRENNFVGFSGSDATTGSITAKYFMKHGTLQGWMLDNWTKDWRGAPRITKYWKQLNVIANQKAADKSRKRG